jgi:hypothetical protein
MSVSLIEPINISDDIPAIPVRYSICTLVSNIKQYSVMQKSYVERGFRGPDCEFLYLDNTETNRFDAYTGLNIFLRAARGTYVVMCHQDVELIEGDVTRLDAVIAELDKLDPAWGLFGNAGGMKNGRLAIRISDRWGENQHIGGPFPIRVTCLDENFIVVRHDANLAVSGDLAGFHLYGTDLTLVAERLGYHAYVVDFHLRHHGSGNIDESFLAIREALINKHNEASRTRWLTTTCTQMLLSGSTTLHWLTSPRRIQQLVKFFMKLLQQLDRP